MSTQKLFQKDFTMVVIGQIISLFGNAILRFALPLYLLRETSSPALFGLVTACSFLPMIVLSFLGGVLADRVNKRNIMVTLDFLTAGIIVFLFISLGTLPLVPLLIVVLMLLYGISGAYQPTVQASIPALVPGDQILSAGAMAIPLLLGLPPMICYIVITAASFAIMWLATMFSVQMIAAVQTETPPELVGKVIALMMSLSMCAQPIGQAVYGVVFDVFSNQAGWILLCVAGVSVTIAVVSKGIFRSANRPV